MSIRVYDTVKYQYSVNANQLPSTFLTFGPPPPCRLRTDPAEFGRAQFQIFRHKDVLFQRRQAPIQVPDAAVEVLQQQIIVKQNPRHRKQHDICQPDQDPPGRTGPFQLDELFWQFESIPRHASATGESTERVSREHRERVSREISTLCHAPHTEERLSYLALMYEAAHKLKVLQL